MGIDDRLRTAASDARAAVAETRGEPIAAVRRRFVFQRILAFGLGAVVFLAGVGLVALTSHGSGTELLPPSDGVTTSTLPTTTRVPSAPALDTTEQPQVTTTMSSTQEEDWLTDIAALPDGLVETADTVLLAVDGLGITAIPAVDSMDVEHPGEWDFVFWDGGHDVSVGLGSEYILGETPGVVMRLLINQSSADGKVYGVAPPGVVAIDVAVLELSDAAVPAAPSSIIEIDDFQERPEVNRSVFQGSFDVSALTEAQSPIRFEITMDFSSEPAPEFDSVFATFGFQAMGYRDSYGGPITIDLFMSEEDAVIDSIEIDRLPEVVLCEGGRAGTPPNQGRTVDTGDVFETPRAAFEAILDGELSDSWFPHSGYVEITDADGNVAYAKPLLGDAIDDGVVMLIEVVPVDGGWTVRRWEGSGC